nr:hypothetical protein [Bradyrhizobium sp.]
MPQEWRPPCRGQAQLVDRLAAASGASRCCAEQGFDGPIAGAARGPLQRRDRGLAAALGHQGPGQDRDGGGVGPARLQHLGGELFRLGELPHLQGEAARSSRPEREWTRPRPEEEGGLGTGL